MRMRFDEDARREYLDAIVFYSNRAEKIGAKFLDAVESAIAKIRSSPNRFRELEEGVRRCRVLRFPYSILYNVGQDEILILAIKHDEEIPTIGVTARTVDGLAERSWIVELEGQKVNDVSRAD